MHLQLPKVTLDSGDIGPLHSLLGAAWRVNSSVSPPAGQYQKLADDMLDAAETVAQKAFAMGVEYAERDS